MSEPSSSARELFDEKARAWSRHYRVGGPLNYRLTLFEENVRKRIGPTGSVLDFGCGTGHLAVRLCEAGYKVQGCDLSPNMVEQARGLFSPKIEFHVLQGDGTALPFSDGTFDAVTASSVFEYVGDVDRTLRALFRVLRPGGALLLTVPNMRHPTRWIENALSLSLRFAPVRGVTQLHSRASLYARYLETSKNRLSSDAWQEALLRAGFLVADRCPASSTLDLFTTEKKR